MTDGSGAARDERHTTVRIGVTGHRSFDDPERVGDLVDHAVDEAIADAPAAGASVAPVVVSSLAEGADRLVARRVLARPAATLEVVLPLPAEDYAGDFASATSRAEFRALLDRAADVEVTGPDGGGTRESAYERAGHRMVDRCDRLFALWDGRPSRGRGGTAEVIAYARVQGRPVTIIPVTRPEVPS